VDSLIEDLAADRSLARDLGQPSAAIAATQLTARLCDRKESGQPGEFSGLQSADEVLALIHRELGEDIATALAAALAQEATKDRC
jgi:hypothetical protein